LGSEGPPSPLQRPQIDHKPVLHIPLQHPLVRLVDLLDRDDLDVRRDAVLGAEVEDLLGLRDAADERAGQAAPLHDHVEDGGGGVRLARRADQDQGAVPRQELEVGVQAVRRGDGVDDEVEAARVLRRRLGVLGDHGLVGAETVGVRHLVRRGGEEHHVRAEGVGQFDGHVPEPAQAHHADLAPRAHLPVAQRRPGRDAGAEQGSRRGRVQPLGDAQDVILIDHDPLGIATARGLAGLLLDAAIGAGHAVLAILLQPLVTARAMAARVHDASHGGEVPHLEFRDLRADPGHPAHDLVPRHHRIDGPFPLAAHGVEVRMADAAEEDLDLHVVRAGIAAVEAIGGEGGGGGVGGVGVGFGHEHSFLFEL